jgi:hypothetical protein
MCLKESVSTLVLLLQVRIELYDRKQTKFISAHNTALACMALSMDGKRLATASDKGTLIRVWNTADGQLLQELRRGSEPATIQSIALSKHCEWLAVCSDKNTVHIFALSAAVATGSDASDPNKLQAGPGAGTGAAAGVGGGIGQTGVAAEGGEGAAAGGRHNPTSMLSFVQGYVPIPLPLPKYFNSEWSFAQYRITDEEPGRSIVGFATTEPHTLVVVTQAGRYHKVCFDPVKGGQCRQLAFGMYVAPQDLDSS